VKVLHVITGLSAGGAEQQLRLLCRHLDPDIEVEVAVLTEPGSIARVIQDEGTPVHHVPMRHNRDLAAVARLLRLMRAGRYDCVHTHLFRAGLYGRLAARVARVPRILASEHSLSDGILEGRSTRRRGLPTLYRLADSLGDLTLAVSSTTRDRMLAWHVPPLKVRVLRNGVDPHAVLFSETARRAVRSEFGVPRDATVLGSLARLVPTKKVDVLLEAVAAIPGLHAIIAGDGPERAALQRRADRLGIRDRVVFAGERPDVGGLLSAVDVYVSACDHETYGLALIEALAAGLPVVYTRCPAIEEQPAALAPDARRVHGVEELVEAVRELAATTLAERSPTDRRPCALVEVYDIRRVADELGRLYRIPGRRRRRLRAPATAPARTGRNTHVA
jgi:glycosyltransferase involved in cell wall biosynthesis